MKAGVVMIKNKWRKMGLYGLIGLGLGYAYYYFIGCASGTCPLSSNPYITSGYGLGAGLLLAWDGRIKSKKAGEEADE